MKRMEKISSASSEKKVGVGKHSLYPYFCIHCSFFNKWFLEKEKKIFWSRSLILNFLFTFDNNLKFIYYIWITKILVFVAFSLSFLPKYAKILKRCFRWWFLALRAANPCNPNLLFNSLYPYFCIYCSFINK